MIDPNSVTVFSACVTAIGGLSAWIVHLNKQYTRERTAQLQIISDKDKQKEQRYEKQFENFNAEMKQLRTENREDRNRYEVKLEQITSNFNKALIQNNKALSDNTQSLKNLSKDIEHLKNKR